MSTITLEKPIKTPRIPAPPKISFEEFLALSEEEGVVYEWENGEVIKLAVSIEHGDYVSFLSSIIQIFVSWQNLGKVYQEPIVMKTGKNLPGRSPDIMFVRNENLGRLKKNYLEGPADLAVEVVSPESFNRDYRQKLQEYEEGGVQEYWIIDPARKLTSFYQMSEDGYFHPVLPNVEGIYHSKVLEGFCLNLAWLWQGKKPHPSEMLKLWNLI